MLIVMSIDHLGENFPGIADVTSHFYWAVGVFSMAQGFVLVSGMTIATSFGHATSIHDLGSRLLRRLRRIYLAHLFLGTVAVMTALSIPEQSIWVQRLLPIIEHPVRAWFEIALFLYCPMLLDILPLYICLIPLAVPVLWGLHSRGPAIAIVASSLAIWPLAQYVPLQIGGYTSFFKIFHPLAWQLLFVAGLTYGTFLSRRRERLLWIWLLLRYVIVASCAVLSVAFFFYRHQFFPMKLPEFLARAVPGQRAILPVGGVINVTTLTVTFAAVGAFMRGRWPSFLRAPTRLIAWFGRESLLVFCWNVALCYVLAAAGFNAKGLSASVQATLLCLFVSSPLVLVLTTHTRRMVRARFSVTPSAGWHS
jgi:hypothetical protein